MYKRESRFVMYTEKLLRKNSDLNNRYECGMINKLSADSNSLAELGELSEWSIVQHSKCCVLNRTQGSNPLTLRQRNARPKGWAFVVDGNKQWGYVRNRKWESLQPVVQYSDMDRKVMGKFNDWKDSKSNN